MECSGFKKAVIVSDKGMAVSAVSLVNCEDGTSQRFDAMSTRDFAEWGGDRKYYRVNFSRLQQSGVYRLEVLSDDGSKTISSDFQVSKNALFSNTMTDVFNYFHANRHTDKRDRAIPVIDSDKIVDAWGGWNDAGGDAGKYLSHLFYSNFFTPQQASFVAWSMLASFENASTQFEKLGLADQVLDEAFWGCDYLHRVLSDEGYFYTTVFDKWGRDKNRYITGYKGLEGEYTNNYQAAFRQGGGLAIAALARAAGLSDAIGRQGEFSAEQYLADAVRAYGHLKSNNTTYCDNGMENIIDDYTALLAATELYRVTSESAYLDDSRIRAGMLMDRMSSDGYFISDDGNRPFYHAVEAGFPLISLAQYCQLEPEPHRRIEVLAVLESAWHYQLALNKEVANPFDYPRQNFQTWDFANAASSSGVLSGFFIPHENETGYWWQGENARLASLAAAASLSQCLFMNSDNAEFKELGPALSEFEQDQFDWILGKNPYGLCMLYGHGSKNPEFSVSGGNMVKGGISNGITGSKDSAQGRGIDFAAGDETSNWRWVEQWTPHGAWYLYAASLHLDS